MSVFQLVDEDPVLPGIDLLRKPLPLLADRPILDLVVGEYGPQWWGEGGVPLDDQSFVLVRSRDRDVQEIQWRAFRSCEGKKLTVENLLL